jgi:hypothetical protein
VSNVEEPLDPAPFRRWVEAWIAAYRAGEEGAENVLEGGGATALALAMFPEMTYASGLRRLSRWRNEAIELPRPEVEAGLDAAGIFLWEVYEDEGFCTNCDQRVNTQPDGSCLVCDGPTARATSKAERKIRLSQVCPKCDGRKARGSLRCRSCHMAIRTSSGGQHRRYLPEDYSCACGSHKQPWARTCWPCYVAKGSHTGRRNAKGDHTLQKITEEVLREAYALYESGLSLRKTGAAIFPKTKYANERSCTNAVYEAFKARGWPLRDRRETVITHNKTMHKDLPICGFEKADGTTCTRRTSKGRCWHHRPENMERGLAALHAAEAQKRKAVAA